MLRTVVLQMAALVCACAATLAGTPVALADGSLLQEPGPPACVIGPGQNTDGCRTAPDMERPTSLVTDPTGRDVYVAASASDRIVHLRLTSAGVAGGLRYAGCTGPAASGCVPIPGLAGVTQMAISPDGRWIAALAPESRALSLLARDPRTGALSLDACAASRRSTAAGTDRCVHTLDLRSATALTVSPNGRSVYVASSDGAALLGFQRTRSGLVLQDDRAGCMVDPVVPTPASLRACRRTVVLRDVDALTVAPDGRTVYAAAHLDDAVAVLARSRATGALTPIQCLGRSSRRGCGVGSALNGPTGVVVSPDNQNVYVVTDRDRALSAFARNNDGTLDEIGCYGSGTWISKVCVLVPYLIKPTGVAVAGDLVVLADAGASLVAGFQRQFGGDLVPPRPPDGCLGAFGPLDYCPYGRGLPGVSALAAPATSNAVYSLSPVAQEVAVLQHPTPG